MQKAYRYRLYPTDEQTQMMTRIIGCCRFVWNRLLEYCSKSYKRRKPYIVRFEQLHMPHPQEGVSVAFRCTCTDPAVCFCRPLRSIQILLQKGCFLPEVQVQAPLEEELQGTSERKGRCGRRQNLCPRCRLGECGDTPHSNRKAQEHHRYGQSFWNSIRLMPL